jgi:hypothetical protein
MSYELIKEISSKHYTDPIFILALSQRHWQDKESVLYLDIQTHAYSHNRERNRTRIFSVKIIRVYNVNRVNNSESRCTRIQNDPYEVLQISCGYL